MRSDLARVMASFDNSDRLWAPDTLTPAQYNPAPATGPYQRLLLAILEDAIRCYQSNFAVRNGSRRILFRETEEWLFDSDGTAFLSCPMVCESLGVNSVQLRRYLREWQLRMKAGHDAPRLTRRSPASADTHIIPPDVSRTLRAPAKSSSMSPGREVASGIGPETSGSDAHLIQGDRFHGCAVITIACVLQKTGFFEGPDRRSCVVLDGVGSPRRASAEDDAGAKENRSYDTFSMPRVDPRSAGCRSTCGSLRACGGSIG